MCVTGKSAVEIARIIAGMWPSATGREKDKIAAMCGVGKPLRAVKGEQPGGLALHNAEGNAITILPEEEPEAGGGTEEAVAVRLLRKRCAWR